MRKFVIQLNKRDIIVVYVLSTFLVFELISLIFLIYLARFPVFIFLFTQALKLLSPVFLGFSLMLLITSLFTKGRELIAKIWNVYLKELFRLAIFSFGFASLLLIASLLLGTILLFLLRFIFHATKIGDIMQFLREWVARNCA